MNTTLNTKIQSPFTRVKTEVLIFRGCERKEEMPGNKM